MLTSAHKLTQVASYQNEENLPAKHTKDTKKENFLEIFRIFRVFRGQSFFVFS